MSIKPQAIVTTIATILYAVSCASPALALNPQPEPPGRTKQKIDQGVTKGSAPTSDKVQIKKLAPGPCTQAKQKAC